MEVDRQKIGLYGIFILMFFWDVIEYNTVPNLMYAILALLLLLCTDIKKIRLNKGFLLVMLLIILQGCINMIIGYETYQLLIKQVAAISLCFIAYDNIISSFSPRKIMSVYWKAAFYMALIGDVEALLSLTNNPAVTKLPIVFTYTTYGGVVGPFPRLASLCHEPSFLGYFLAPAVCMYLGKIIVPELTDDSLDVLNNKFEVIIILAAYIMTFSAVAYFGLGTMLIILWWQKGFSYNKLIIPVLIILLFLLAYNNVADFRMRINDTWNVFNGLSQTLTVNLSSFTYYANWNVAYSAFFHTKGFGSGIGSYQNMFDRFNIGNWGLSGLNLNREDGNSAFFRILTELGVLGLLVVVYFLVKNFRYQKDKYTIYSCAILTLFFMFLLRQGSYVHAGSIMFVCLYLKVAKMPQAQRSEE
ncbi:hypothetical protein EFR21_08205 [Lactobacillus delbrueckii subsp. bulgaricus]|uniref:hypothetical protein n=1 Tax=Lactobacillus delbrueckii TaxID=1584 RepID=UPI0021A7DDB8|nr:hypothetical protein [Lactobacillus delbrueckii]MCT3466999.1 hypothetical protein [Lactobacillus delbrueckii subsp. bulgaricus]MCT3471513.1 hypothetical protein [Lactobacillus delbrueckii subsp. bulgaricus]